MEIIRKLQEQYPTVFTKRGCYDGRKNLYSPVKYSFKNKGQSGSFKNTGQFEVNDGGRNPRCVRIQLAARINPASVRPAIGKMLINVDISSAAFYKSGSPIKLCLEYLGRSPEEDPSQFLSGSGLNARTRRDLLKFIRGLNVRTQRNGEAGRVRAIKDISEKGADNLMFTTEDGRTISVAPRLRTGKLSFASSGFIILLTRWVSKLGKTAWVPMELCDVVQGQFYRKTLTPDQTKHMVEFSTPKPEDRLRNIRNGLQYLGYGNSPYLQDFGINVDPNLITIKGRILPTPTLLYGQNVTIQPRDGRWNMRHKTLYKPEKITGCAIIVYDQRFRSSQEEHLKKSLLDTTRKLGIQGMPPDPPVLQKDPKGDAYWKHLQEVAMVHKTAKGNMPNLIIVVLPDLGYEDIYVRVKNAGNVKLGVATLCLK
ncbi:hypothetical protein FRC00_002972, partial [Tulasnella sp. 408]